ncbi:MAG: gamma carbonic anhydrase family protein [Kofleriaceae bacterium]|nr:gamma carbonic anhydrase family protein [Myxococcales bacterium]MCB9562680.1 gamma carbonic anhydrase family protein [Kofleriaceae bacterium]MCB9570999.1 gamma carbonic anhydrase family protein [Kofleriaceae bacterium]
MAIVRSYLGTRPVVGDGVFLADNAAVIGDVVIGAGSSVWFGAVVRGDQMPIRIGATTSIQDNSVLHVTAGVAGTEVGSRVTVGHNVILHACTVADDCIIGMGAIILDRSRIGRFCVVGAGALVTPGTDIPDGSMVMGAPARVKRAITDEERAWIASSAAHYVELTRRYLAEPPADELP